MIVKQVFGRSGHQSSCVLLGAAAFSKVSQNEADTAMELALSSGVNHVDTAPSYGESELRVGSWIARHGKSFFLATKTGERTAPKAREEILRSLERLHVDKLDMVQLHNLVDPHEWETALGPGGALEALIQAREEGLIEYLGITGHGVTVAATHRLALERFDFDSVLLPFSYLMAQNKKYLSDFWQLVDVCRTRNIAVQTIKSLVHRPWDEHPRTRATWYQPLEEQSDIDLTVHWILGHDGLFLNTSGDVNILPRILDAAASYRSKPSDEMMQQQIDRLAMLPLFT